MDTFYQTEAVFSTQKETVSAKSQTGKRLTEQKSEEKVYASGIPIGIYIKTEGILVLGLQQIDGKILRHPVNKGRGYILKLKRSEYHTKHNLYAYCRKMEKKKWC